MIDLLDKVVVVTGAGSGIGRALALNLAAQNCRLALTDIDEEGLQQTAELLGLEHNRLFTAVIDVSDKSAMQQLADDVFSKFAQVDVVINNAGTNCSGYFETVDFSLMEKVIEVNLWGVIYGSRFFLPYLRQRPQATLVNVASLNSMIPFPTNGPYNISKYAVLGLNETLMVELADTPINVLSVHPGAIKTNLNRKALNPNKVLIKGFEGLPQTSSEEAAKAIVTAIQQNKSQIFIGKDAKLMQIAKRISSKLGLWCAKHVAKKIATNAKRTN